MSFLIRYLLNGPSRAVFPQMRDFRYAVRLLDYSSAFTLAADPAVVSGAAFILMAVGLPASAIAARRAAQVDPMASLRYQ